MVTLLVTPKSMGYHIGRHLLINYCGREDLAHVS